MKDYKKITRDTYNAISDGYIERDHLHIDETEEVESSLSAFTSLLPPQAHVLDVGIGGGGDSRRLAEAGFTVVGIDIAEELLEKARLLDNSGKIHYLQMDFEELDFPENSFDGVWANASLHHIPKQNLPKVLQKIHGILKPLGYVQIKMHRGTTEGIVEEEKFGQNIARYFAEYELQEIQDHLENHGFSIDDARLATKGKWIDIRACAEK